MNAMRWDTDVTIIPTSAISVPYANAYGSRQYATFMDVRSWDCAGPVDDQLLGRRLLRRQRRDMACRAGEHPRLRAGLLDQAVRVGQPELPAVRPRQTAGGVTGSRTGLGLRLRHSVGTRRHGLPLARAIRTRSSTRASMSTGTGRRGSRATRPPPSPFCRERRAVASSASSGPRRTPASAKCRCSTTNTRSNTSCSPPTRRATS